jgi:hypothetical protein
MPTYNIVNPAEVIKPTQMMSLGDVVNIGRGMQQYQSEQLQFQQAQREANERQPLADFMANQSNYMDDQGNIDLNKATQIFKIAPNLGADTYGKMVTLANNQTIANNAKLNLNQDILSGFGNVFIAAANSGDNKQQTVTRLQDYANGLGVPAAKQLADAYIGTLSMVPEDQNFGENLRKTGLNFMSQEQQTALYGAKPGVVQTPTGAFTTSTQVNPVTQAVTTTVAGQPFMTQSQIEATGGTDVNGNPTYFIKDARGNVIGQTTTPEAISFTGQGQQAGQQSGQIPGRPVYAPASDVEQGNKLRLSASQNAMQYPTATANANEIIRLAPAAMTGTGSDLVRSLSSNVLFQQVMGTGDEASKLDSLGHYLSLQTSTLAQSSGLSGTDAANQLAGEISGTKQWTPQAIVKTSRVNRALAYSSKLLSDGYNKAYNDSNRDPTSSVKFQQQWASTVDMDSIRLMDAFENRAQDPTGFDELIKEMGGNKSARFLNAANKINAINSMVGKK